MKKSLGAKTRKIYLLSLMMFLSLSWTGCESLKVVRYTSTVGIERQVIIDGLAVRPHLNTYYYRYRQPIYVYPQVLRPIRPSVRYIKPKQSLRKRYQASRRGSVSRGKVVRRRGSYTSTPRAVPLRGRTNKQ